MKSTWQNMIVMMVGLWLWVSPFVLHFKSGGASSDASVAGIFIASIAMMTVATQQTWGKWATVILGAWLIASPWLLGFSQRPVSSDDVMIVGAAVVLFSLWSLVQRAAPRHIAT